MLFLVYATIKMLGSVEASFNQIWGVKRPRSLVRKLTDYLAIVVVLPIALLVGTAFTTFLTSYEIRSVIGDFDVSPALTAIVPLVSICLGMSLVLLTLPNTRVRVLPALAGGMVAGTVWQVAQVVFVEFQLGLTRMNAVFSSFAAVPLLLSWIYLSWVTIFVGAELSYAIQNERTITSLARTGVIDQRARERLGVRLAGRIAAAFLGGAPPPNVGVLAAEVGVAPRVVAAILDSFAQARLMVETSEDADEGFLPARDPDTITVFDLLLALRTERKARVPETAGELDERADRILSSFDSTLAASSENITLRELAASSPDASADAVIRLREAGGS